MASSGKRRALRHHRHPEKGRSRLLEEKAQAAAMSRTDADWILKAMIAMAAADDRLDGREVSTIQRIYQAQTGRAVDARAIVLAVQTFAARRDMLDALSFASGSLRRETKEAIVRAAYLTAVANQQISAAERETLKAIATALHLSDKEVQEIVDSAGQERDRTRERGRTSARRNSHPPIGRLFPASFLYAALAPSGALPDHPALSCSRHHRTQKRGTGIIPRASKPKQSWPCCAVPTRDRAASRLHTLGGPGFCHAHQRPMTARRSSQLKSPL